MNKTARSPALQRSVTLRPRREPILPWLYHTGTIQQWYTTNYERPNVRFVTKDRWEEAVTNDRPRKARTRVEGDGVVREPVKWKRLDLSQKQASSKDDKPITASSRGSHETSNQAVGGHVPFEGLENNTQPIETEFEGSTITPTERKVFEKLLALKTQRRDNTGSAGGKIISKQSSREPESDAVSNHTAQTRRHPEHPRPEFPAALRPMVESARENARVLQPDETDATNDKHARAVQAECDRVIALMNNARTDFELWGILTKEVLNRLVALQLDPVTTPRQLAALEGWRATSKEPGRPKAANSTDLDLMKINSVQQLQHFMHLIQDSFPASMLGLNLLPTLKKLGPSVLALSMTTELYNSHMRLHYRKYPTDLTMIVDTLREMDREVYDFDEDTLELLMKILTDARRLVAGDGGPGLQALWRMASVRSGLKGLRNFKDTVEERLQEAALRRVREEEGRWMESAEPDAD